jgi:hypothetical protein
MSAVSRLVCFVVGRLALFCSFFCGLQRVNILQYGNIITTFTREIVHSVVLVQCMPVSIGACVCSIHM